MAKFLGTGYALVLLAVIAVLTITACAGAANAEPAPPTIHYGEDVCELCGMIISEERFAAGYITRDGGEHIFDDIGDMFRAHLQNKDDVAAFFVHDYDSQEWIRAESAFYVRSPEVVTPMASNLAAVDSSAKATALAAKTSGQVLSFDEVLSFYQASPPMAMDGERPGHGHGMD